MGLLDNVLDAPVSSVLTVLLTVMFLGGLIGGSGFAAKVQLVVSDTLGTNMYIWNVFTAGLFETNVFKLAFDLGCVLVAGRRVEAALGVESFAILVCLVNLAAGVLASTVLFALYVVTRFEVYLFTPSYGFGGLVGALLVALKWLAPREPVNLPGLASSSHGLQCAHLPLLWALVSLLAAALGFRALAGADALFVVVGTYVGWWYLRFVHRASGAAPGQFGDTREDFALVTLFPPSLRGSLAPLADFCYGVCLLLGFFKDRKAPPKAADALLDPHAAMLLGLRPGDGGHGGHGDGESQGGPEKLDPVAERRRQKAREQLDAKLAAMEQAAGDEQWDDDVREVN